MQLGYYPISNQSPIYGIVDGCNLGPKLLSMEKPIPNVCLWNCHADSKGRSSEFIIPNAKPCVLSIFSNLAFEFPNCAHGFPVASRSSELASQLTEF